MLAAGVVLGPLPVWRHVPFGSKLATRDHVVTAHDRAAARVLRAVPAGVAVSATNTLGAHLSERRRIFSFPVLRRGALGRRRPDAPELPGRRPRQGIRARLRDASGATRAGSVVRAEDGVVVLRRSGGDG